MEENQVVDPNAPAPAPQAQPAPEKSNKEKVGDSFTSVFMDRLKEQGFTVLLMCGILYYQHTLWMNERAELIKEVDAKEERILQLAERETAETKAREAALREKRDQFIETLKEQAAACRGH
jgi:hypothetical protein